MQNIAEVRSQKSEVRSQKSEVRSKTIALLDAVAHGGNPQDRAASLT
ncbi:MAG: hypothetical protein F6K65_20925 [Moorea sp. SIO3C2]|nr:hypothetical protein [Moorena sp. SIO3C2]